MVLFFALKTGLDLDPQHMLPLCKHFLTMNIPTGCLHREQSLAFRNPLGFENTAVCDGVNSRLEVGWETVLVLRKNNDMCWVPYLVAGTVSTIHV
jgi:hypothetical protein